MPVMRRFAGLTQTTADMEMVMDGLEATRKIRLNELGTARRVPIIAITANAFDDDRRKCFEAAWTARW
jgi:CheY-like chemotaxis protein